MEDNNDKSKHFGIAVVGVVAILILVVVTKNFFDSKLVVAETDRPNDYKIPHSHVSDGTIWQTGKLSDHAHETGEVEKAGSVVTKSSDSKSKVSGKELYTELGCAGCHGAGGKSGNPMFPTLAGKSKEFIVGELKSFQNGTRKNPLMEPNAIKAKGSEDKIAEYLESQK